MKPFKRETLVESTPLSDFFRNASSSEKKKVYNQVLKRATERQQAVLEKAKQADSAA